MDGAFFPARTSTRLPDPGSAEVIVLRRALLVLGGRWLNPLTEAETPLPPHRFVLFHDGERFSESGTSGADGITGIFAPDTTDVPPDGTWELMMIPIIPGRADSDEYARSGVFIDVDKNEWVPSDDLDGNKISFDPLLTRRLTRFPLWRSTQVAKRGLGFAQTNPHSPGFAKTGLLRTDELLPHGTPSAPWVIRIDHGWVRTFAQIRYYDFAAKADRNLPLGILLHSGNAASSVQLPDGTFVLAHPFPKLEGTMDYSFICRPRTRFGLTDRVMRVDPKPMEMADILVDYAVPRAWTSAGGTAWIGPGDPTPSSRKPFAQLQTSGTSKAAPLCFHLDDVLLVRGPAATATPIVRSGTRCTVFDGHLKIVDQTPGLPYSTRTLPDGRLPAEDWFFVRGQGVERRTRLIEHGGQMFDVSENRCEAGTMSDPGRGARVGAALEEEGSGFGRVGLVDCRYLDTTYDGATGKLAHVLAYTSAFVNAVRPGPNVGVALKTEQLMLKAAEVWTGQHPGLPGVKGKEYAFLAGAGKTIVRLRVHFGAREHAAAEVQGMATVINVLPEKGRATGGNPMKVFLRDGSDMNPPIDPSPPAVSTYEFEPDGNESTDRFDDVPGERFTLAHELGHWLGFPDEYLEDLVPGGDRTGFLPRFKQSSPSKHYHTDGLAMMKANLVMRLRYAWQLLRQAEEVAVPPEHWFAKEGPFVPTYAHPKGKLRYVVPDSHPAFTDPPDPWDSPVTMTVAKGHALLYPMSEDETTRGPLFLEPSEGFLPEGFDGLCVFVVKFWFDHIGTLDADDLWEEMVEFGAEYFERSDMPRFCIRFAGATTFKRVAVLVQPTFELGANPNASATRAQADILVQVRDEDDPPPKGGLGAPQNTAQVSITLPDVDRWLMRFALRDDDNGLVRDNSAFGVADFADINAALATALSRAPGKVEPF